MPRIPQYERQADYPAKLGAPMASFGPRYSFWTAEGRAFEQLGSEIQRQGRAWEPVIEERIKRQNALLAIDDVTAFSDEERAFLTSERAKAGKDSIGAVDRGKQWYKEATGRYLTEIRNPDRRLLFERLAASRRENGLDALQAHEMRQDVIFHEPSNKEPGGKPLQM